MQTKQYQHIAWSLSSASVGVQHHLHVRPLMLNFTSHGPQQTLARLSARKVHFLLKWPLSGDCFVVATSVHFTFNRMDQFVKLLKRHLHKKVEKTNPADFPPSLTCRLKSVNCAVKVPQALFVNISFMYANHTSASA